MHEEGCICLNVAKASKESDEEENDENIGKGQKKTGDKLLDIALFLVRRVFQGLQGIVPKEI